MQIAFSYNVTTSRNQQSKKEAARRQPESHKVSFQNGKKRNLFTIFCYETTAHTMQSHNMEEKNESLLSATRFTPTLQIHSSQHINHNNHNGKSLSPIKCAST